MPAYSRYKKAAMDVLDEIRASGLYKKEKQITSPQGPAIDTEVGENLNFCANNYLGLANHPDVIAAAHDGLDNYGYGLASVRFICGTQNLHNQLENRISQFLSTDDTILYSSCFDANGGLFETLTGPDDSILSDALNHASIIDGVRLSKAKRFVYANGDTEDLEEKLREAESARFRLIATDGVFSMNSDLAPLDKICDLADRYDALVMVDDSHATGFIGKTGRGTPEHFGVQNRIDVMTSTLGKALGGASGGFTTGRQEIIELLRQRSRPYLFSNTIAPPVAAGAIKAIDLMDQSNELVTHLHESTQYFRTEMSARGFPIKDGIHPIVPIMVGDEARTLQMAKLVNDAGIFVVGFSFPVVPKGQARIRVQISAAHTRKQLDRAMDTFEKAARETGVI
ncbi:MAG: glycine C-acetyltransferase [Candidatus Latescibacterota bacterium]|nr:glycine C-acetyltransferase [Candidatus Latescibacterota bacterium]